MHALFEKNALGRGHAPYLDSTRSRDSCFFGGVSPSFTFNGPQIGGDRAGISAQVTPAVRSHAF